ncbi:MAG: hypothetical protein R2727_04675 [Bacteroidales bacterium]
MAENDIRFDSQVGRLDIRKDGDLITMNFPQYRFRKMNIPDSLVKAAGFTPIELYECDHNWKMALLADEQEVKKADPDFQGINRAGFRRPYYYG